MGRSPSIPAEKKTRIVLSVLAGEMSIAEAARKEKVSEQSIGGWKAEFLEAGKTALVAGRSGPSLREQQLELVACDGSPGHRGGPVAGAATSSAANGGAAYTYDATERLAAPSATVAQVDRLRLEPDLVLWRSSGSARGFGVATKAVDDILPTPQVSNQALQNHIDALYKGTTNSNRVGNGTPMDAIRNKLATGVPTAGRMHSIKGQERLNGLNQWLRRNPDAPYYDRLVAQSLADELSLVLRGAG